MRKSKASIKLKIEAKLGVKARFIVKARVNKIILELLEVRFIILFSSLSILL